MAIRRFSPATINMSGTSSKNALGRLVKMVSTLAAAVLFLIVVTRVQSLPKWASGSDPRSNRQLVEDSRGLDFFIAGFEKCGTTYMLHLFEKHPETDMVPQEACYISSSDESDEQIYRHLQKDLEALPTHFPIKRGIKCPRGLQKTSLKRLQKWYPSTKILVALRHPIHYFRSFYNFRVASVYKDHRDIDIPPIQSLVGDNDWLKVSTDYARFEQDLMNLGKTGSSHHKTPFQVMLYSLEQVADSNDMRRSHFGHSLSDFLGLSEPLETAPHTRIKQQHTADEYPESVDICDPRYEELRSLLLQQGKKTAEWIKHKFLKSPDVHVINESHFLETLDQWQHDPCDERASERRWL